MPKQSVSLEKNDFLLYLHLTQSEAAKLHNVSLSCFKRYFHQMFRPRIHWSTKKDRIMLRKAINYPTNNILTQELVEKFLNGTLRAENEGQVPRDADAVSHAPHQPTKISTFTQQRAALLDETETLVNEYHHQQKLLQHLIYQHSTCNTTNQTSFMESQTTFKGYPEFVDGPWKVQPSDWEIQGGPQDIPMRGLLVVDKEWNICASNDIAVLLTGYSHLTLANNSISFCSLLPSSCNLEFIKTVFNCVLTHVDSLSTTATIMSCTNVLTKMYLSIHKYSEGFYIFLERNESISKSANLLLGTEEYEVPCIGNSSETPFASTLEIQTQLLQCLFECGLQTMLKASQSQNCDHQQEGAPRPDKTDLVLGEMTLPGGNMADSSSMCLSSNPWEFGMVDCIPLENSSLFHF
mmetsp:Transcript_895/g.3107  ORF Transcript_895/g.3107 Transcript_895/m.3107 type:complete len:407 (-) Transcript_895:44-1264(-)